MSANSNPAPQRDPSVWPILLRRLLLLLGPAVALAVIWQATPLKRLIEPQVVVDSLGTMRQAWWSPPLVAMVSAIGCVLMVPLTLVVLIHGALYALPVSWLVAEGSMLSAAFALYFVGRRAGSGVVERVLPTELRDQLGSSGARGVLGLAALRWIPIAHFGLLSMSLGALGVPLSRFMLSTLIGQTPVVTLWVVLGDRIRAGLIDPNLRSLGLLFGAVVSLVMVTIGMRMFSRWRKKHSA